MKVGTTISHERTSNSQISLDGENSRPWDLLCAKKPVTATRDNAPPSMLPWSTAEAPFVPTLRVNQTAGYSLADSLRAEHHACNGTLSTKMRFAKEHTEETPQCEHSNQKNRIALATGSLRDLGKTSHCYPTIAPIKPTYKGLCFTRSR